MDHTVTVVCKGNGTVSPAGPLVVSHGNSVTFKFTPASGSVLKQVLDGTLDVTAEAVLQNSYVLSDIQSDVTITAVFSDASLVIETVDRAYVKANKDKSDFVLVDVRPAEYFDGKSFQLGVVTGGHIAGAINVPRPDIESATADQLTVLGLTKDKTIILYCNTGANSLAAAQALETKGYKNLKNYAGSMNDWGADPAETVVIAGLELAFDGTGTVSVDVPKDKSVIWTVKHYPDDSTGPVVELSSATDIAVDVLALQPGTATLKANISGQASAESTVTVASAPGGGSSGGCDMILAPGALLLLAPLLFLRR